MSFVIAFSSYPQQENKTERKIYTFGEQNFVKDAVGGRESAYDISLT